MSKWRSCPACKRPAVLSSKQPLLETTAETCTQHDNRTYKLAGRVWNHGDGTFCSEQLIEWKELSTPKLNKYSFPVPQGG
jgi:hypothetical protein